MNHLIILPGWMQNATHWEAVHTQLSLHKVPHTIIDLPGFGSQPYDANLSDLNSISAWFKEKIDSLNIEAPVVLVGHSYGGRVAVSVAASLKGPISRIVLIGSPNLYMPTWSTRVLRVLSALVSPIKRFIPEFVRMKFRSDDYQAVKGTKMQLLFSSIIAHDQSEELSALSVPVQLLWGRNDMQAPIEIAMKMRMLIPACELEIIEGAGHDLHLERPQLLASKLASYANT